MPAVGLVQARRVYGDVMAEMLRTGRLDQAQSLLELRELRQSLQLDDDDHHAVVGLLDKEHPDLLEKTSLERQSEDLRRELAQSSLAEFLERHRLTVLAPQALAQRQGEELERLRLMSGLSDPAWQAMVQEFGPQGEAERQRLVPLREAWMEEAALLAWLTDHGVQDPPLRPLQRVLAHWVQLVWPRP